MEKLQHIVFQITELIRKEKIGTQSEEENKEYEN